MFTGRLVWSVRLSRDHHRNKFDASASFTVRFAHHAHCRSAACLDHRTRACVARRTTSAGTARVAWARSARTTQPRADGSTSDADADSRCVRLLLEALALVANAMETSRTSSHGQIRVLWVPRIIAGLAKPHPRAAPSSRHRHAVIGWRAADALRPRPVRRPERPRRHPGTPRSRRTSNPCQTSRIGTPTTTSRARRTSDTASDSSAGTPNMAPSPA